MTVEGKAHRLPDPFLVIATQNPYEHRDVFELPESQLDRFLFKIVLDYADAESEYEMLDLPHKGVAPDMLGEVRPLLGVVGLDRARDELDATEIPEEVGRYMVALARASRNIPGVELGVSSRAIMHLASACEGERRLSGRDEVAVEDVREIAPVRAPPPAHRRRGVRRRTTCCARCSSRFPCPSPCVHAATVGAGMPGPQLPCEAPDRCEPALLLERIAPSCAAAYLRRSTRYAVSCYADRCSAAALQRALDLALGVALGDDAALVGALAAAREGDLDLHAAVLEVHADRDEREALLAHLPVQRVDLAAVEEELAVAVATGGRAARLARTPRSTRR